MGVLSLAATGCAVGTETPFRRTAGDAASSLSAAATTLRFAHDGHLTFEYGRSTFQILGETLDGLEEDLPRLEGKPGTAELDQLLSLYRQAEPAISDPCLDVGCAWQSQVDALEAASEAFARAAEG
jgi:hypothetical protein